MPESDDGFAGIPQSIRKHRGSLALWLTGLVLMVWSVAEIYRIQNHLNQETWEAAFASGALAAVFVVGLMLLNLGVISFGVARLWRWYRD